jgi:predicted nucleotidyltransferase
MQFIDDTKIPDQPYPELRDVLHAFVDEITAELGENLVGIYLVGSIASGDFDLDSDVDFLVVTRTELTEANRQRLQEIQGRIHEMQAYPAQHLEGSYISLSDLNDAGLVGKKELFYFDNGSTTAEQSTHDNKWHVRWVLRERGVTLAGPSPATLLPPAPVEAMRAEIEAVMLEALELYEAAIDGPRNYFNSRFGQSFFVLTYCRMLHTLHTGTVQSKKAAMEWAKQVVDPRWVKLIDQAWEEREGVRFMEKIRQRAEQALLQETLEFMKYAVAQIQGNGGRI